MLPVLLTTWLLSAAPSLTVGEELIYTGDAVEECVRFGSESRRQSKIEVRCFVLGTDPGSIDLAVLTLVKPQDDAGIAKVAAEVTGAAKETLRTAPQVRLELLRLDRTGRAMILTPALATPPLELQTNAKLSPLPPVAVETVNPLETGLFPDPGLVWLARPATVIDGAEVVERASETVSADWKRPTLNDRPWRRTERVWISPNDGVVRVLWRRMECHDGPRPATRVETRLDLQPTSPHKGEGYTRIRREIEFAWHFAALAEGPVEKRAALAVQIARYVDDYPATPYRPAVEAVARRLSK